MTASARPARRSGSADVAARPRTAARTLGEWLGEAAAAAPEGAGVLIEGDRIGYRELDARADRVAAGFAELGIGRGERVCVVLDACPEFLTVWFGLARRGIVEVPLNPEAGRYLLGYYLADSGAAAVVCGERHETAVRACLPESVRHVVVVDGGTTGDGTTDGTTDGGTTGDDAAAMPGRVTRHRLSDLEEAGTTAAPPPGAVSPGDPAVILYTSGTTGPPKGVVLSHQANVNLARHTVALMGYSPADRLYSVFPLFHSNARYCSVMAALEAGAELVMHRRFSASRFWDVCREQGITAFNYQGAMMSILFKQPSRPDDADNPVRAAFGAPCPQEIFAAFEERFDVRLTEIFGSTEVSIVTDMPPQRRRIGTSGRASANYEVAVVDERDEPLPPGRAGEIVARPRRPGWMFDGYHGMPAETARSWRNLWFHTGDRGYLDEDGYLTFLDRLKDTVRRRGENISSWEVERVVAEHPSVAGVAAYGVPSQLSEEDVMVAVVPADGATVDPVALLRHCAGRLTSFAIPRYVRVVEGLPLTPSQRVEKYKLRADGVTPGTFDREAGPDGR
ncbi:crotonobetaine/carnitine-CoA ligase [Prauserella isguenensis]|uniref:Crotonobetaine/carnitine-CoA ligase n=1 Tax=Prauserella isguenensis TaxID=1470180 RepID=A0A839S046_9PSEU|nr:AMP-binding protein [Prauserella isguenensis]MBB3051441.1 crotonobetaine/carnitine-CoA ligase [Prauserella isguenensis]